MNKHQLRRERIRLKVERREILRAMGLLQVELNDVTEASERKKLKDELSRLGELLQRKVMNPISDHSHTKNSIFQESGKLVADKKPAWSMDYDRYVEFKKQSIPDKQIAEMVGATIGQLNGWKRRNNIIIDKLQEAN